MANFQIPMPYIYISPRVLIREEVDFDNDQGIHYQEAGGEHAIWAARIPFLPAMVSEDFTRLGVRRIGLIQQRQFRFINDLARARESRATFELRFISTPNSTPGQPNLIDVVFLGKVFSKRQGGALQPAKNLWEKFVSNFPLEDPFGYPLEPVENETDFRRYYEPISFEGLHLDNMLEIRKFEEMPIPSMAPLGRVERKGDYIAHPFVPSEDFNPMGRFFVALASQPQKCYAGISIRPIRMYNQEIHNISFMIGQFKKTATEDDDVTEEYIRTRSKIGIYVYRKIMQSREQLMTVRVHLIGKEKAPRGLAEALGSEMMGNAENTYPTMWSAAQPVDEQELAAALNNLRYLEQDIWGHSIAPQVHTRLRYLATAEEAYGAFRLPVPPESGFMPGILVKNEPFVAPADELELRDHARANQNDEMLESRQFAAQKKIDLGYVYHRGKITPGRFTLNVSDLTRHALIAGSTGSGKSTTLKHILSQLWIRHHVPFLVLYPLNKTDYRDLLGFDQLKDDLLIFTLGDENVSPFRFNPFEVPDGVLLKTHLSRLMGVFTTSFHLADPLPMVYRTALRKVYQDKGWDTVTGKGDPNREAPVMSEFLTAIRTVTESLKYGREVGDNVRQASVIRIEDLLENTRHILNVRSSMDIRVVLERPTVMELGRIGSTDDITLLMGFLLMRFAEEVERHPRPADLPHITVVEEAHRLMAESSPVNNDAGNPRGSAGDDFANILAEVRGYGEGILIAEQIPTLLVKGAIGNTYIKIMHWLEDAPSYNLFCNITNLNEVQRNYARTLTPGFAVVRSPFGRPVHVKVPEFGDQPGYSKPDQTDLQDDAIANWMQMRRSNMSLNDVPVLQSQATAEMSTVQTAPAIPVGPWAVNSAAQTFMNRLPMQTCLFCVPFNKKPGDCPYGIRVRNRLIHGTEPSFHRAASESLELALRSADHQSVWVQISDLRSEVQNRMVGLTPEQINGVLYCYLAHWSDVFVHDLAEQKDGTALRTRVRHILAEFLSHIGS